MAERRVGPGRHSGVTGTLIVLGVLLLGVNALEEVKRKVGDDVTLVPKYNGDPSEINWKINGDKLVDMERKPKVDIHFYRLQGRATINDTNGVLTIRNLDIGDSAFYTAEALVNNVEQKTEFKLSVLHCPTQPNITDKSTADNTVLFCESSSKDFTYKWQKNEKSVGTGQSYTEPRHTEDVTLTCIVLNELCNSTASRTIRYIPESRGLSGGVIALIIILALCPILIPILILVMALCYEFRKKTDCMTSIYGCVTQNKESRENQFKKVHSWFPFKENNGQNVVNPETELLKAEESESCGCISLNLPSMGQVELLNFKKEGLPSITAEMGEVNGQLKKIIRLFLTIHGVNTEELGDYVAEAFLSNGKIKSFPIKEEKRYKKDEDNDVEKGNAADDAVDGEVEGVKRYKKDDDNDVEKGNAADDAVDGEEEETGDEVIVRKEGDTVTLTLPDAEKVKELVWKNRDVTLFEWKISGLELHAGNITLEPGSVTIKNLLPGDSGLYEIDVHSNDNRIAKNAFQLEVTKQVDKTGNHRIVRLKVVRKVDLPKNGPPESQPIRSITFHPIKMTGKTPITWKKDGQPVVPKGDRIKLDPNGDLTINNVTPEDLGKYSVHCEGQELKQEFILH